MSDKNSKSVVDSNSQIWVKNFPTTNRSRRSIFPLIACLENLSRKPTSKEVLGRFIYMKDEVKEKKERIKVIRLELEALWKNMSILCISSSGITKKLETLTGKYDKYLRRKSLEFEEECNNEFDISQLKEMPKSEKLQPKSDTSESNFVYYGASKLSDTESTDGSDKSSLTSSQSPLLGHYSKTAKATGLVTRLKLSTHKASKVCDFLDEEDMPSQSGIWRSLIRYGEHNKAEIKKILDNNDQYCLHFDGKKIDNKEYQVVIFKNITREIKLGILCCKSGSASDIYNELRNLIDEYNAWTNIGMIICDTTAVNTGRFNGVVVKIQDEMIKKGLQKPQYIGCQHHILDRILRHVLDSLFDQPTTRPTINYSFIDILLKNYERLQKNYNATAVLDRSNNPAWRDDFKFLFELCHSVEYYKDTGVLPIIKWQKLPSLHQARWNSRAIYVLIGYFLLPDWKDVLDEPAVFISFYWKEAWFADHKNAMFKVQYEKLLEGLNQIKCCKSAITCLQTHWCLEESVIDIPRSNIVAERGVKVMEEILQSSKTTNYANLKFLAQNNL